MITYMLYVAVSIAYEVWLNDLHLKGATAPFIS